MNVDPKEVNVERSTIEAVATGNTPEEAMRSMTQNAIAAMEAQSAENKIDGWHVSIVEVDRNNALGIGDTLVAIVTVDGKMAYGPLAFPMLWAMALRDTLNHAIEGWKDSLARRTPVGEKH